MIKKLEQLSREYALKDFYTAALNKIRKVNREDRLEDLVNIAPFIRKFSSTFVNYYVLKDIPSVHGQENFGNRLEEFYSNLSDHIVDEGINKTTSWLLSQRISEEKPFFSRTPVVDNYQDIARGLNALNELLKGIGAVDDETYDELLSYATAILTPRIDEEFEQTTQKLLDQLIGFDARKEGVSSKSFGHLSGQITAVNERINSKLMSNNSYVSVVQQITEINKALKTVFKTSFTHIFNDDEKLEAFWNGLQHAGYVGGENCVNGSFDENRLKITQWLDNKFSRDKETIVDLLEKAHRTEQLPKLAREPIPEAIQLYALNLLGFLGLRTEVAIKLALGFHSRFVSKMIRDGAYQTLRKNAESVKQFFYRALKNETDYKQKLLIAEKHDTVFEQVPAASLITAFGPKFKAVLQELDGLIGPDGIFLDNFIKSAYMKQSDDDAEDPDNPNNQEKRIAHFKKTNKELEAFKAFVEKQSPDVFDKLLKIWGLNYIVSWSLADYRLEERLFEFIIEAANEQNRPGRSVKDQVVPLNDIITLLTRESDAKSLIEKLMTFLLNSKISFDYPLFRSLFRVVAQRNVQLGGSISIRDGFSEQRGYTVETRDSGDQGQELPLHDPHIFHPIVIFLITVLNMKAINIPKDAFVETDISLYLNSLAGKQSTPELGYQMYLAHKLISSIPYIVDFASKHEGIIRKTIADLDESYSRKNVLMHYHRIKIHRAPSKLDLDFCLAILEGLSGQDLNTVLSNLTRLMKGIGDEAIPDLEHYFQLYSEKLQTLGKHLRVLKNHYPDTPWQEIAENDDYRRIIFTLPNIDDESARDATALVKLVNALSNYWTHRLNDEFIGSIFKNDRLIEYQKASLGEKLSLVRTKRMEYRKIVTPFDRHLEPFQNIFLKRHVIQSDWNFDFFGFWPFYSETKFEVYNIDRKLALLERSLLENRVADLSMNPIDTQGISENSLMELRETIECLVKIMVHQIDEGLSPSKFFLDTIEILEKDQLTISQLYDILQILSYRELSHVDSFIANTFGHFPARITQALGRENLDYGLDNLSTSDDELLFPHVQETVLGNIIAEAHPIHLLEDHLSNMMETTSDLVKIAPSEKIFPPDTRPPRELSPVTCGYKSYALTTLTHDGFNVPALETLPVDFYLENIHLLQKESLSEYKTVLIDRILILEEKTDKLFDFRKNKLSSEQWNGIEIRRRSFDFDTINAPQLILSARSGSYRSMPGILGTVINVGYGNIDSLALSSKDLRFLLDTYRMFLSTFGNVVFGINEIEFSQIVALFKRNLIENQGKKIKWEDLDNDQIINIISEFKQLIEMKNHLLPEEEQIELDWDDPLALLAHSTIGVWNSWDSEAALNLREFLGISDDWKTPVTLMEMKQADKNPQSFSAILFSGDPQGKTNKPHGDLLFGRPGEDIAAGLASEGTPLETVEKENPALYGQIVNLLEKIKINKGNIDVDVELVGEYDPLTQETNIFVLQERQMPRGTRAESEDYRLTPTDLPPAATGKGVNGGVQYGVFIDGVKQDYYELKEVVREVREKLGSKDRYHGPGIFLLMKYVTPEEALKMNIPGVDGVVTTKIGKSSHASISAKRDGKLFVCESNINSGDEGWEIDGQLIRLGHDQNPDLFTIVGNPKSVSPYSGNIYPGIMPLTQMEKKR
ncbi:MAG: hypothetical protein GY866_30635 [Proteobacteria bacterium]|nr:hypothetical protein [Pseudomonadota bacterium]